MEIVYCGGCGKVLGEDDFAKGLAQTLDNRHWCAECRPPDKKPISGAIPAQGGRKTGSSAKHPRVTQAMLRSDPPPQAPNKNLLIGLGVAGIGVLALVGFLMSKDSPSPPPVDPVVRRPPPPPPPPPGVDVDRLLKEFESFASLAAPEKILARCDELRSKFAGTPQEKRFLAIESGARDQKNEAQLARELEDLRKQIEEDPKFANAELILKRFRAAKDLAGARAGEVERRMAAYQKSRQESPHEKHLGPFETDGEGFIRNWLVLGVFPNENDKGFDTDFLKTESAHDPVEGLAVGKLKWGRYASPEARIDFFAVPPLGIKKPKDMVVAYAACLVQVPGDVAAEFRMGSDDAVALWVDGREISHVHKPRSLKPDEDRLAVPLGPGVHRVLVKVENHGGGFEFVLRIVGPDGMRVSSLRVWN